MLAPGKAARPIILPYCDFNRKARFNRLSSQAGHVSSKRLTMMRDAGHGTHHPRGLKPMRRLPERLPRRVSRPLLSVPTMLLLVAAVLGVGWPWAAPAGPAAMLRFSAPAHGPYLVISAEHLL